MDPNATIERIVELANMGSLAADERDELSELMQALADRLACGGFAPRLESLGFYDQAVGFPGQDCRYSMPRKERMPRKWLQAPISGGLAAIMSRASHGPAAPFDFVVYDTGGAELSRFPLA